MCIWIRRGAGRCVQLRPRISLASIALMAAAMFHPYVVFTHDIGSVRNINTDTVNAQFLPPLASQLTPSSCISTSDCYALAPESHCLAGSADSFNSTASYVTHCSLCPSQYRFGAAPRVCAPTATCMCAGSAAAAGSLAEFSVGLRPHLATLVATSTIEDDGRVIECDWQFQTLQGDDETPCQQLQLQLLARGLRSRTRLALQVTIDAAALLILFKNHHSHAMMLMDPSVDDFAAHQGGAEGVPCELCLILLNSATSPSCFHFQLPIATASHGLVSASSSFEFFEHWKHLHGQSAQLELISAGAHAVSLGTSHVIILDVPDAINRSNYISQFSIASSLHERAILKNSLVGRLPPPVGDRRFLSPLPPLHQFGHFHVKGLVLPARRAVAMCIVGETRNFFEDNALTAKLIRDNIGNAVGAVDYFLSVTDSGWRAGTVPETEEARRELLFRLKSELGPDRVRHAKISRKFHSDLSHHFACERQPHLSPCCPAEYVHSRTASINYENWADCEHLVAAAEEMQGWRYSWLLRWRPDYRPMTPLPHISASFWNAPAPSVDAFVVIPDSLGPHWDLDFVSIFDRNFKSDPWSIIHRPLAHSILVGISDSIWRCHHSSLIFQICGSFVEFTYFIGGTWGECIYRVHLHLMGIGTQLASVVLPDFVVRDESPTWTAASGAGQRLGGPDPIREKLSNF